MCDTAQHCYGCDILREKTLCDLNDTDMWNMTHSLVRHDSLTCATRHSTATDVTLSIKSHWLRNFKGSDGDAMSDMTGVTLQHAATHCNTLQHTATHYNTLQHTATHCNTLPYPATHCNNLQHAGGVISKETTATPCLT